MKRNGAHEPPFKDWSESMFPFVRNTAQNIGAVFRPKASKSMEIPHAKGTRASIRLGGVGLSKEKPLAFSQPFRRPGDVGGGVDHPARCSARLLRARPLERPGRPRPGGFRVPGDGVILHFRAVHSRLLKSQGWSSPRNTSGCYGSPLTKKPLHDVKGSQHGHLLEPAFMLC